MVNVHRETEMHLRLVLMKCSLETKLMNMKKLLNNVELTKEELEIKMEEWVKEFKRLEEGK